MNFQTVEIPDVAKSKYTARKKSPLKEPKYKDVRRFTEQLSDPIVSNKVHGNTVWTKLKKMIFETDESILKEL
jgi:hypothetical protein